MKADEEGRINIQIVVGVTQQNAATAEQSASAAEEMNSQAREMKAYVAELLVLVGNGGDHAGGEHGGTQPMPLRSPAGALPPVAGKAPARAGKGNGNGTSRPCGRKRSIKQQSVNR